MKFRFQIILILLTLCYFKGNSQITFEESKNELIQVCKFGDFRTFVREINKDSLLVNFYLTDLKATDSDNIFLAFESESHKVEFKATYTEIESLNSWIKERHKTQTSGSVKLGEWRLSYVQPSFGALSIFLWTGSTGNFETAINSNQIKKCLSKRYINQAIQKYAKKKRDRKEFNDKREMLRKAKLKRDSLRKVKRKKNDN
jgi:hypothetical protein